MSDAPEERPRTWIPLVAAGAAALLVLIGAVVAVNVGGGPDETEAAVIAACEEPQAQADDPEIVAGEIYDPTEWRDHYAVVETHADVPTPLADLSEEAERAREALAESYRESGDGAMVIVWRLADDSYRQCTAPVADGEVDAERASVGELEVAAMEPAP